jgi:hypothetical protein
MEPELNTSCSHHYGMCCYSESDVTRCPLCHVRWALIDSSGWHSCTAASRLFAPDMRPRVGGILAKARLAYEKSLSAVV